MTISDKTAILLIIIKSINKIVVCQNQKTKPKNKQKKSSSVKSVSSLKSKVPFNKKLALLVVVIIAALGAYFLFFASAATNNCQPENGVQICDVDMTGGGSDTVLSVTGEAQSLGNQGWGVYWGANFRAPTTAYNGAVPVYRVYNASVTLHDWVTSSQKAAKEAKYGALSNEGVAFFAWESQKPGTVAVYRLGRGGEYSQNVYSTDRAWIDKMIAENANNPDGWKAEKFGPLVAFYAFPPGYKAANAVNPYDCSILENYVSTRCTAARANIDTAIASGAIPKDNSCPTTYAAYQKAPFPGQFAADCQKKWNAYAQDCTKQENYLSDRCKGPREALAAAQAEQARLRAEAAARAVVTSRASGGGSPNSGRSSGSSTASSYTPPTPAQQQTCSDPNPSDATRNYCAQLYNQSVRDRLAAELANANLGGSNDGSRGNPGVKYRCRITWVEYFSTRFVTLDLGLKASWNAAVTGCNKVAKDYKNANFYIVGFTVKHNGATVSSFKVIPI